MGIADAIRSLLTPLPAMQTREIEYARPWDGAGWGGAEWGDPYERTPLAQQIAALRTPASLPTVAQALGVPSVFRAVNLIGLISNLPPQQYRIDADGAVAKIATAPVVARPDPFQSGRDFYRDTATSAACYGEFVWYVAARDPDGRPASLVVVPPYEIKIEQTRRPYRKSYAWRGEDINPRDMVHRTIWRDVGALRGAGPLQKCSVALAVAAEAEIWAEKFFGGSPPLVVLEFQGELTEGEAADLLDQWNSRSGEPTRVLDQSTKANKLDADPQQAQLIESRQYSAVNTAQMFGIPAPLLEAAVGGSQLTYRTIPDAMRQLLDLCLEPMYLGPIEDAMSDLLPRGQVVKFDRSAWLRATSESTQPIYALPSNPYGVTIPQGV